MQQLSNLTEDELLHIVNELHSDPGFLTLENFRKSYIVDDFLTESKAMIIIDKSKPYVFCNYANSEIEFNVAHSVDRKDIELFIKGFIDHPDDASSSILHKYNII